MPARQETFQTTRYQRAGMLTGGEAAALLLCFASGALFSIAHAPVPWMIGPLLAMAVSRFFGAPLEAPKGARPIGQVVIGCALGLYFTPTVAREVVAHWYLLVAAAFLAILLAYISGWFLTRSAGLDRTTALFASVPGGAAEMTILGERFGAHPARVVVAQSLRVIIVVLTVPFAFTMLGLHGSDVFRVAQTEFNFAGLVTLVTIAVGAGALLFHLGTPNAWMLGPLMISITLTVLEVHLSSIPTPLSNLAQMLLGCALGSRFERESLRSSPRLIVMVCISVLLGIVFSGLAAWGIAIAGVVPIATMVLATAPGGMAEMCITAKVLQLGVPLVTAAHVTRVIILVTTTGPTFRLAKHLKRKLRSQGF
jgi:uncharacterized protein